MRGSVHPTSRLLVRIKRDTLNIFICSRCCSEPLYARLEPSEVSRKFSRFLLFIFRLCELPGGGGHIDLFIKKKKEVRKQKYLPETVSRVLHLTVGDAFNAT